MSSLGYPGKSYPISPREESPVLRQALAKIVLLGEKAGVSLDQMILLLNSGMTVGELLDYVFARAEIQTARGA